MINMFSVVIGQYKYYVAAKTSIEAIQILGDRVPKGFYPRVCHEGWTLRRGLAMRISIG